MKANLAVSILLLALLLGFESFQPLAAAGGNPKTQSQSLVLVGGTLIDVSNFGKSIADIKNAVVVIQDGRIVAAGSRNKVKVPAKAQIIDVSEKYIVPGLIDGFAALGNQAQANAYLYMGVTSIVGVEDRRRPHYFSTRNQAHAFLILS